MTKYGGLVPLFFFFIGAAFLLSLLWGAVAPSVGNVLDIAVGGIMMNDMQLAQEYPEPLELQQVDKHAFPKHPEAQAIQDACNSKGPYQTWKDKFESKKFYYLCAIGDGAYGIIPVVLSGANEVWKTAFSPGSGNWADTIRYLSSNATRYTGSVK